MGRLAAGFLLLSLVMAGGCLQSASGPQSQADSLGPSPDSSEPAFRVEARDCVQAGGNSVFKGPTSIGPFQSADQRAEIGDPLIGIDPRGDVMLPGDEAWGNWHVATQCKSYTFRGKEYQNFQMGMVAVLIERPEFDQWGTPRIQFMVPDLSFGNVDLVEAARDATGGAEISPVTEMSLTLLAPDYIRVIFGEANHGTFQFTANLEKTLGLKEDEHTRYWMLPAVDGSHSHEDRDAAAEPLYRPVAIDIWDTATGGGRKLAGENLGPFVHINGLEDRHQGNIVGHYQDGFDRIIELGPAPDGITFDVTWLH